jgi:hypothetical protein
MATSFVFAVGWVMIWPGRYVREDDYFNSPGFVLFLSAVFTVLGAIVSLPVSLPFSFWLDNRKLKRLYPAIEALDAVGRPASLAALATASRSWVLEKTAASALASVTARLRPDDYGALPSRTVPALCHALLGTPSQTVLVLLQALTVIGDGRAIPAVETLSLQAMRPEVREAATQLLPLLQQRARNSRATATLLRASHAPAESSQILLRAARDQSVTDPSQLLRIANSHDPIS